MASMRHAQVRREYEEQRFEGKGGGKRKENLLRFETPHLKQQSNHRRKNNDDDQGAVEEDGAQRVSFPHDSPLLSLPASCAQRC